MNSPFRPGSDRSKAINAIVAGVIAGLLLTMLTGVTGLILLAESGFQQDRTLVLLAGALMFLSVTIGIWKHVLAAAIIGLCGAIGFIVWAVANHELVAAAIVFIPFVGGFWNAARGILALRRLRRR